MSLLRLLFFNFLWEAATQQSAARREVPDDNAFIGRCEVVRHQPSPPGGQSVVKAYIARSEPIPAGTKGCEAARDIGHQAKLDRLIVRRHRRGPVVLARGVLIGVAASLVGTYSVDRMRDLADEPVVTE